MSSANANAVPNTAPLIPSKETVNQSAPPQNIAANNQFLLSNPALGLSVPPSDTKLHRTTEVVDLYVVKFDEGIPLAGNSTEVKCMVIDAPRPPQYQTILGSFPKTPLQYDVSTQYPAATAFNRDKALAALKDSVLAAYMAQRQGKVSPPTAIPQLPQVPALPSIISAPFANSMNNTAAHPALPAPGAASFAVEQMVKQPHGNTNGSGRNSTTPAESDDMMDFGGFFPMGTAFIADDVEFVVEADPAGGTAATITPPVTEPTVSAQQSSKDGADATAVNTEPVKSALLQQTPVVAAVAAPNPVSNTFSAPSKPENNSVMDVVAVETPPQENPEVVDKTPSPFPAAPTKAVDIPVVATEYTRPVAVDSGEAMDVIPPPPVEATVVSKPKTADSVAAIPRNGIPVEKHACLDKPAETHLIEAVPVKVEKSAKIPANALATGLVSDPKPEIEKAAVKMEEDVKSESAKPVESVEKETSALGSEDKALSKDASQVHSVVEPTDTKKRLVEVVADQGFRTWKKRCLVEKSVPTFDEATELLGCGGADKINAVRRIDIDAKSLRAMISNLSQTAKSIKKKPKIGANGANSGEALGQSMWDKTGDPDAEENVEKGGESSGKSQVEWVQCDACKKWRTLPVPTHPKYPSALDEDKGWICSMNSWAPHLANCQVPEESMLSPTAIKIRIWLRRIRTGDKYEARNNLKPTYDKKSSGGTSINSVPVDWIRCCSPVCGKWRACLRTMNGQDVKNIQYPWYCWMASWDETKATCSAPQEGFTVQGYNVAVTESDENNSSSMPGSTPQAGSQSGPMTNGFVSNGGGARRSGYSRSDNGDETVSNADTADDGGDDEPPPTIGISSRGRIVRSKFNVRKHLASSKK